VVERGQRASLRHQATLQLLGGFELAAGGVALAVPPHVERLVAFLALQGRPLRRTYVAGKLWLHSSQEQAFACLRTTLWRLRRVSAPIVHATSTHLALDPSVAVDARELVATAERFLRSHERLDESDIERLAHASELLPDWYDDWVGQERDRIEQLRLLALESVCEELVAASRYREAATAALAAVASDPLRESARRLLISTYLNAGNDAEALRQYADFRTRLEREVGLEPSFRMLELARTFRVSRRA
jgi:DNA-binding SARP family transcriptional activator